MLHADLSGRADLLGASAHDFGKTRRRHRTGNAHFALAAHFRAGNRGIHLEELAHDGSREEKAQAVVGRRIADEFFPVGEHRRNHAAGAVRGGGDDASARRILFGNGEREHVDPVDDRERIHARAAHRKKLTAKGRRTARHAKRPRKDAFRAGAAFNAFLHHLMHMRKMRKDLLHRAAGLFVFKRET